jgi:hypothetical protein
MAVSVFTPSSLHIPFRIFVVAALVWVAGLQTGSAQGTAPATTPAEAPAPGPTVAARFPEKRKDFMNKFQEFMTASKRPDLEESYAVFNKLESSGAFSDYDMKRIVAMSNLLAGEQKLGAFPYFKNYVDALSAARMAPDTALFGRWHTALERAFAALPKGRVKPIAAFLEFSADFMEQRALRVGEIGSATWRIQNGTFEFVFDKDVPILECRGVDLIGLRKRDSIVVWKTNGSYFPYEGKWKGKGGTINWAGTGLDSTVYAELTSYHMESIKTILNCDTANLVYPLYFGTKRMAGSLEHNIYVDAKGNAPFPRFESFDKNITITRIGDGIEYVGGFRLAGSSFYGYGTNSRPAQLTINNNRNQRVFYGTSHLFIVKRGQNVVAEDVTANLFMGEDTLYHPDVNFRVDLNTDKPEIGGIIYLTRGNKGTEKNPFYSTYYKMNLGTDKVAWFLNKDSLEIGSRTNTAKGVELTAAFESNEYYSRREYDKMQMIADKNPISTLYILYLERGRDTISDNDFATVINPKFDYSSIQSLLAQMAADGFINYNFDQHKMIIRPKLKHYALASQGKKDFDNIRILSTSTNTNAQLNLKNRETRINEVGKVELSLKQRVAFIPYERQVTLLKNRDMRFNGRLFAGFALFEGKNQYFNYDAFQMEFDSIQHLDFYLPTGLKDADGQPTATAMNSTVERVSGFVLVDAPRNKSGRDTSLRIFPSLQSKRNSFVYYDQKTTQNGAYKRDSFYFKLDPFSFNSLDNYTKEQLRFKGELIPATIFPKFRETIVVREEDKSFGFVHKTPEKGYSTYSDKGNFTGELDLSNKGLVGKGKLEYLTADMESKDLVFKPKQTTGTAEKFFMEEARNVAVPTPQAKGEKVSINWLPFRDTLYVESKAKAFELFKAPGYTHKGIFTLTPKGLKGRGEFEWEGGKLISKVISYGPFQAYSDTADLQIKALQGKGVAFDSKNIKGELDFDKQAGDFKANSEAATTTLPLDQYMTSMNEFTWDMKGQTITFKADEKKPGRFISIDPDQDSLSFSGKTAFYDMKSNELRIGSVDSLKSADAYIFPDSAKVEISPGGKMQKFENAIIVADTVNRYHTITRATVEIGGKKFYKATGFYQYNLPGGKNQEIFFNNIVGERRGPGTPRTKNVLTTAEGQTSDTADFRIDIKTLYKGKIIMEAKKTNLRFEGFAKLDADTVVSSSWFMINADVDKNNPVIRIKNTKDEEGNPLIAGFYLSKEFGQMYPRILAPAYARVDRPIMDCEGYFKYDAKNDRFIFGDSAKLYGTSLRGARMSFENKLRTVQGEGPVTLGSGLKYMKVKAAGRMKSDYNTYTDSTGYQVSGELMTGIELTLPKSLMDLMVADIKAASFDAPAAIYTSQTPFYQAALSEFITEEKDRAEALAQLQSNLIALPKKDNKFAFVLGRHPVQWNSEYQSFITTEDKIPVISVQDVAIAKTMTVFAEYKMPTSQDDRFYLYVKASPDLWYFFGYQPTEGSAVLNVVSSSVRFNDLLAGLKTKETQIKMPGGDLYEIVPANPSMAEAFLNRVRSGRAQK